jgi:hypothetical protein
MVGATSLLPIRDCCSQFGVTPPPGAGLPTGEMMVTGNLVTTDFFRAAGIAVRRGRTFTDDDQTATQPVVVINETMARVFWPHEDVLGKVVKVGPGVLVVGVVADIKQTSVVDESEPQFYRPYSQNAWERMGFVIRMRGSAIVTSKQVRDAVHSVDPGMAIGGVTRWSQYIDRALAPKRVFSELFTAFGAAALALALAGIYGVLAFQVSCRTQELGVRVALGADRARVVGFVLREAALLGVSGVGLGVVGAGLTARALAHVLYGVRWDAPWRYVAIVMALLLATVAAAFGPAWRASRVDPIRALRAE